MERVVRRFKLINQGRGKFCSKECYYKSLSTTRITDLSTKKICTRCGQEKVLTEFHQRERQKRYGKNSLCKDCETARVMEYYYSNPKEISDKVSEYTKEDRKQNPEKYAQRRKAESTRLWQKALEFFGPCSCCGESTVEFLSIDHINGHGNDFRRSTKSKTGIYLLRNFNSAKWPEELKTEYRILCMNCNFAIGHSGNCPHHPELKYTYWNPSKRQWDTP